MFNIFNYLLLFLLFTNQCVCSSIEEVNDNGSKSSEADYEVSEFEIQNGEENGVESEGHKGEKEEIGSDEIKVEQEYASPEFQTPEEAKEWMMNLLKIVSENKEFNEEQFAEEVHKATNEADRKTLKKLKSVADDVKHWVTYDAQRKTGKINKINSSCFKTEKSEAKAKRLGREVEIYKQLKKAMDCVGKEAKEQLKNKPREKVVFGEVVKGAAKGSWRLLVYSAMLPAAIGYNAVLLALASTIGLNPAFDKRGLVFLHRKAKEQNKKSLDKLRMAGEKKWRVNLQKTINACRTGAAWITGSIYGLLAGFPVALFIFSKITWKNWTKTLLGKGALRKAAKNAVEWATEMENRGKELN